MSLGRPLPALLAFALSFSELLTSSASAAPPPPKPWQATAAQRWTRLVQRTADRTGLAKAFAKARYNPPQGADLLIARLRPSPEHRGRLQIAYFSLGDSGFAHSRHRFWPASSIKLPAAVGALLVLGERGIDGRTRLSFKDSYGTFSAPLWRLYRPAIVWSSNRGYDRLLRVAGVDRVAAKLASIGLPSTYLSCPYAGGWSLMKSPAISYRGKTISGTIPPREAKEPKKGTCHSGSNCTTLFELSEVLRRVVLHDHLAKAKAIKAIKASEHPEVAPLALKRFDVRQLQRALRKAKSKLQRAAERTYGKAIVIYNKAGRYPYRDQLDVALIVDKKSKRPLALVAASVPYLRGVSLDSQQTVRFAAPLGSASGARLRSRGRLRRREKHVVVERRLDALVYAGLQALRRLRPPASQWLTF